MENIFLCPKCGKEAHLYNAMWIKFTYRLDLPHFMCGDCRLTSYDKTAIKKCVTWLRKVDSGARSIPFAVLYKRVTDYLDGVMDYNVRELGYKVARFRKHPRAK